MKTIFYTAAILTSLALFSYCTKSKNSPTPTGPSPAEQLKTKMLGKWTVQSWSQGITNIFLNNTDTSKNFNFRNDDSVKISVGVRGLNSAIYYKTINDTSIIWGSTDTFAVSMQDSNTKMTLNTISVSTKQNIVLVK